jgi:hypothetical protein
MTSEVKKEFFSEKVTAGSRTYFLDVKESREGIRYLLISEAKRSASGEYEYGRVLVFHEYAEEFCRALERTLTCFRPGHEAKGYDLGELRQRHARAYTPWSQEEDERLRQRHGQGASLATLAAEFQRQPGAIRSRLTKLLGYA